MTTTRLLPSQKNDVAKALEDAELDGTKFIWEDREFEGSVHRGPALLLEDTDWFFHVYRMAASDPVNPAKWLVRYSPASEDYEESTEFTSWSEVAQCIGSWCGHVARETAATGD